MKKLNVLLVVLIFAVGIFAQKEQNPKEKKGKENPTVAETKTAEPVDLAKAALTAQGGDKFKNMKTLIVRGTADISGSPTQTFPSAFAMIFSGDKYRYEITNPFQPFKQIYDGEQTVSSIPNFTLPPINRLGLPLLQKLDEKGYTVSALPEKSKKKTGFRITSPEGYYTDFFVDEKTGQIKGYEASYTFNERNVTTSVEIDKIREVDGVKIPEKYAQRFELGFATIYADFKAKDILINTEVASDVFSMAK
ncbi:MAG TPA: hypothetical protein VNB22_13115 [Pyrinomonadaceae bacterium]|nr:hypothetical protein [Pyrinomonadaceae bacterium]